MKRLIIFVAVLFEISRITLSKNDNCVYNIEGLGVIQADMNKPIIVTYSNCYSAFFISGHRFLNVSPPVVCFSQIKKTTAFFIVAVQYNDLSDFDNFQIGGHEASPNCTTTDQCGNLTIQRESVLNELSIDRNRTTGADSPSVTNKSCIANT